MVKLFARGFAVSVEHKREVRALALRRILAVLSQSPHCFGLIVATVAVLVAGPSWALDKVSLQLKRKYQFQFAGGGLSK
jgi:hypothetical protein